MLTIRFARTGRKNRAQFRIVLQENSTAPTGKHIALLGSYDPHLKKAVLKAEVELVLTPSNHAASNYWQLPTFCT